MRIVDRRDSATLLPIISSVVAPGSIVHSDEWSSYHAIQSQLGLTHRTVNHSIQFITPTLWSHTGIEVKLKIKAIREKNCPLTWTNLCGKRDMERQLMKHSTAS